MSHRLARVREALSDRSLPKPDLLLALVSEQTHLLTIFTVRLRDNGDEPVDPLARDQDPDPRLALGCPSRSINPRPDGFPRAVSLLVARVRGTTTRFHKLLRVALVRKGQVHLGKTRATSRTAKPRAREFILPPNPSPLRSRP